MGEASSELAERSSHAFRTWPLVLLGLGIAWRLLRYGLRFPIWGDEAFICLNVLDRGYGELLGPLRFDQVAPWLFLWGQRAALQLFGVSEWALRLLPLLAGLTSLLIFAKTARRLLPSWAGLFAAGILAVSYYPLRHSCEIKPYATDLLASVLFVTLAARVMADPGNRSRWALLIVSTPLLLGLSYPAIFVAGAVSAALLLPVRCHGGRSAWRGYLIFNMALVLSFLGMQWLAGLGQFDATRARMGAYWNEWFPPSRPMALASWLVDVHTGNMLAYPVGGKDGASTATFLLCLTGVWGLARSRRWDLLILCVAPFGLTLAAAALHRYPYGGSARVAQHLAPLICLLAGNGLACFIPRNLSERTTVRCVAIVCTVLAVVAVSGLARDLAQPYKTPDDQRVREFVRGLAGEVGPGGRLEVLNNVEELAPTFEWYLRQLSRTRFRDGGPEETLIGPGETHVVGLHFFKDGKPAVQPPGGRGQRLVYSFQLGPTPDMIERCEVFRWVPSPVAAR